MLHMAIDEPKPFRLLTPRSVDEAADMAARHWPDAAYLAGGCDLLDQLEHRMIDPHTVIDLKGIASLAAKHTGGGTVRLGALTRLADVERDADLGRSFPALTLAASRVATPQIRNRGTIGGNLLQDSRCPYYRDGFACYRAGGLVCYAHHGLNYEHAIFGADRCWTVTPSDLGLVMVALEARIHIYSAGAERVIPAHKLFVWPRDDILHMHALNGGEVLTEIEIPERPAQRSTFIKNAPRNAWDFSRVSVAVALEMAGDRVRSGRIVLGGAAATPWRCFEAERRLLGKALSPAAITAAAEAGVAGASPLPDSDYKVPLARRLIREALEHLASSEGTAHSS